MADKKTFIVVLQPEEVSTLAGIGSRSPKTMRVAGDRLTITPEGYKITVEGDTVFAAPHHQVRYMQEEKSLCDNAATGGAQQADLRDVVGKAENEGLLKGLTTEALPRFTSLQEMAKDFHSSRLVPVGSEIKSINAFVEYLENRLRVTMVGRR